MRLKKRFCKIKMILFDVDGVLTDGDIIYDEKGNEIKKFNILDGMGITIAREAGLITGVITGRKSGAVERRCNELGIDEIFQNAKNKLFVYEDIIKRRNLNNIEVLYIGDDVQDIPVLKKAGIAIAVKNSVKEVKSISDYVTSKKGGDGALREIVDKVIKSKSKRNGLFTYKLKNLLKWNYF